MILETPTVRYYAGSALDKQHLYCKPNKFDLGTVFFALAIICLIITAFI